MKQGSLTKPTPNPVLPSVTGVNSTNLRAKTSKLSPQCFFSEPRVVHRIVPD